MSTRSQPAAVLGRASVARAAAGWYLPGDITKTTATGRNLVFVPSENGHPSGVFLTVGNVTFTNVTSTNAEITKFSGTGKVVDVCQVLA